MIIKFNILLRNRIKRYESVAMATRILQNQLPWQRAYVLQFLDLGSISNLVILPQYQDQKKR